MKDMAAASSKKLQRHNLDLSMVKTETLEVEKNWTISSDRKKVLEGISFHAIPYTQAWNLVSSSHPFETKLYDNSKFFIIKTVELVIVN